MMDKLKPCPFCGGEAKRNDDLQNWGDIFCSNCGCHMAEGNIGKAIKTWNTRSTIEQGPSVSYGELEEYLFYAVEQAKQEQREKDAEICFDKANEYEIPCQDISDRHGGKVVAANTCGHAILSQEN